jgi:hypothetical protein
MPKCGCTATSKYAKIYSKVCKQLYTWMHAGQYNMPNEDAGDNYMFAVCRCKDMHAAIFMRQHMPTRPQLWGWVVVDDKTTATFNRNRKTKPQEGYPGSSGLIMSATMLSFCLKPRATCCRLLHAHT